MTIQLPITDQKKHAKQLLKGMQLPAFPRILQDINRELAASEPDLHKIALIAKKDVAVSAMVLKLVNSPLFGLRVKSSSVPHAMSLLGLERFKKVVIASALRNAVGGGGWVYETFWENSMAMALICGYLAPRTMDMIEYDAYLAGLFHDVGVLLMYQKYPDYEDLYAQADTLRDEFAHVEFNRYHITHTIVGEALAHSWYLPRAVTLAIATHHEPILADIKDNTVRKFVALLTVGQGLMCRYFDVSKEKPCFHNKAQESWAELEISDQEAVEVQDDVAFLLDDCLS